MRLQEFIIGNDEGIYLCYDKMKRLSKVKGIEKATKFETESKARNVLMCSLPKKKRTGWRVIAKERKEKISKGIECDNTYQNQSIVIREDGGECRYRSDISIPEERKDWDLIRKNFEAIYSDIVKYKEEIFQKLIDVESELCDCEHACEFFKFNAAKGYNLYSMIRERRIRRRYLKNEYKKISLMLNMSYQEIAEGKLEKGFKEIDEQSYKPRVLKELFEN